MFLPQVNSKKTDDTMQDFCDKKGSGSPTNCLILRVIFVLVQIKINNSWLSLSR